MSDFHSGTADLQLDCQTCLAANTTACSDCVVTHLLANDDGPIELVTVALDRPLESQPSGGELPAEVVRAVDLFTRAGLVDDPPTWADRSEFEALAVPAVR